MEIFKVIGIVLVLVDCLIGELGVDELGIGYDVDSEVDVDRLEVVLSVVDRLVYVLMLTGGIGNVASVVRSIVIGEMLVCDLGEGHIKGSATYGSKLYGSQRECLVDQFVVSLLGFLAQLLPHLDWLPC
ncbi:hypothetical protein Tco_1170017 [Tanacetum coccineum]